MAKCQQLPKSFQERIDQIPLETQLEALIGVQATKQAIRLICGHISNAGELDPLIRRSLGYRYGVTATDTADYDTELKQAESEAFKNQRLERLQVPA